MGGRFLDRLAAWLTPDRIVHFFGRRRTRAVLAWLLATVTVAGALTNACLVFRDGRRPDHNRGHTTIDFGGQWLMGRLLALGHGRELYHRDVQRRVLADAYPRTDEVPEEQRKPDERGHHDADDLMTWVMGSDDPAAATTVGAFVAPLAARDAVGLALLLADGRQRWTEAALARAATPAVGGPLYPPLNAFLMAPLGRLRPQPAYHVSQFVSALLGLAAATGVWLLTRRRVWWPVAVTAVFLYPGFNSSMDLGQNAALTLAVLVWGWLLLTRGWPACGGVVWGLLAFKPVWAAAFFLVPLLTRRWRFAAAMVATGVALAAATLPVVGWQTWLDWLHVGAEASDLYLRDDNWIFLSRDLLSIPRRWLLDFQAPLPERESPAATVIGWALLLSVVACTAALVLRRRQQFRAVAGPAAAFVLLGGWLSCFHFMYYDILLTALPVCLLLMESGRYLVPRFVVLRVVPRDELGDDLAGCYKPGLTEVYPPPVPFVRAGHGNVWVLNSFVLTVLAVMLVIEYLFPVLSLELSIGAENTKSVAEPAARAINFLTNIRGTPWHTFCVLALWLWCGWRCWTERLGPPGGGPANVVRDGSRATDALSVRGS